MFFLESVALQISSKKVHLTRQQMMTHEKIIPILFEVKATLINLPLDSQIRFVSEIYR